MIELYLAGPYRQKAKSTQAREREVLRALYPTLTGKAPEEIRAHDVRAWIGKRLEDKLLPSSINRELATMATITAWAIRELEWGIPNPWHGRRLKERNARTRFLSRDEADRLIAAAESLTHNHALADFIRLGLNTGLRVNEMLNLTWDRVDFKRGLIMFEAQDQKNRKLGSVPINAGARVALLARQRASGSKHWVFSKLNGTRYGSMEIAFQKAVAQAGLVDVWQHDLRRTCASWLVQDGVPLHVVSRILRHSNVSITAQRYAHLAPEQLAEGVAALDLKPTMRVVK